MIPFEIKISISPAKAESNEAQMTPFQNIFPFGLWISFEL
jgi:hypothetical protein